MAKHGDDRTGNLVCSFCGKRAAHVEQLVAGPKVFICNECVATASRIMSELGGTALLRGYAP